MEYLSQAELNMAIDKESALPHEIREVLQKAGFSPLSEECVPLSGGRNNRAYRVDTTEGPLLAKQYFSDGEWDRLETESRFLLFCADSGIRRVPRLLLKSPAQHLAVHSWMDGEALTPGRQSPADVAEAAAFLGDLVKASQKKPMQGIPAARDAFLDAENYFRSPRERLQALEQSLKECPAAPLAAEAWTFAREKLRPTWERFDKSVRLALGNRTNWRTIPSHRIFISPSDFGFHNAMRLLCGGLGFVDFEYSGRDDKVKAIGDFIFQPSFPPPPDTLEMMAAGAAGDTREMDELINAVLLFAPLFCLKFCCIILNEFKSVDAARRSFSIRDDAIERRRIQLDKAKRYLSRLESGELLQRL